MTEALSRADRVSTLAGTAVAFVLIGQQVAAKATRDALFLSQFPAEDLPKVMIGSAILSVVVVLAMSRLLARFSPATAVPAILLANGLWYAAEWGLAHSAPAVAGVVVYLHTAALGGAVVSGFWSVINERFDPHTAKTAIARIAAGATVGGVGGGIAAWQVSAHAGVRTLLLVLAVANVLMAFGLRRVGRATSAPEPKAPGEEPSGLAIIGQTPYLGLLAALVALAALAETAIDYVFKASVASSYADDADLAAFFAIFHMGVAVATFGVQTTLARRSLQRLGLAGTAATLPMVVLVGGVTAFVMPILWTLTALRGAAQTVENSLFRSAYELTYTPLPPEKKRPTKTIVDVGSQKLSAAFGSGVVLLLVALAPDLAWRILLGIGVGTAVLSLFLTELLHRGYIEALAESLRSGAIELDQERVFDATTRRTLADTMALDRRRLLAEIEALREADPDSYDDSHTVPEVETVEDALAVLKVGRVTGVRAALDAHPKLEAPLVPAAIELLGRDAVLSEVVHALRAAAPTSTAPLLAALRDQNVSPRIRRRIPRVLRAIHTQEVVDALVEALSDEVFEVRYRSAVALLRMTGQHGELRVREADAFDAVRQEMALGPQTWRGHTLDDEHGDERSAFDTEHVAAKVGRSLTYVFIVLALVLDREATHLAFCALASDNQTLRGTGLEYLDSVLPNDLRDALAPHFADRKVTQRAARPRQQIVEELLRSRDTLAIDRQLLLEMIKPPE